MDLRTGKIRLAHRRPGPSSVEIHHAEPDDVIGLGRAVLEIGFHVQDVSPGGIGLELVEEPPKRSAARAAALRGGR